MDRSSSWLPLLLALGSLGACGQESAPGPRHVLLVTLDTTRADHLGAYGQAQFETPALDALAAEGTVFEQCSSAAATTLSSHASLMTGTYPLRHGVARNGFSIHASNRMLAEVLGEAGFRCAAFVASSALVSSTGLDQGFEVYDERLDLPASPGGNDQAQRRAASVTSAVLGHVDEVLGADGADGANGGERMFLFAHYFDPHAPYGAPGSPRVADFDDIEAAVVAQQRRHLPAAATPPGQQGVISAGLPESLARMFAPAPGAGDLELAALYGAEVEYLDAELGRLLAGLAARGVLEDTLVVITADHGETFWEQGNFWNHGLWVGQPDVHVPLLVRGPGVRRRARVGTPVSGVDVAPTILEAVGLSPGAQDDPGRGRSLLKALRGGALPDRAVFAEATQPGPLLEGGEGLAWPGERKPQAVRLGPWKLVVAPYLGLRQLFHLGADPGERRDLLVGDLSAEARDALGILERAHAAWRGAASPRPSAFDPAQAEALKGLGYGDGSAPSQPR